MVFFPDINGAIRSQGHNLIGALDGSSGITNGVNNDLAGTAAIPLNPGLLPLAGNGGPTPTMALLFTSPAVAAGDPSILIAPYNITTDQRGYPREVHGFVDIGAYQSSFVLAPPQLISQSAAIIGSGSPVNGLTPVQLAVQFNPNAFFLYTPSQMRALTVGGPLLQKNATNGLFTLTIGVQMSADLTNFTAFPMNGVGASTLIDGLGNLEFSFPGSGNAAFFRLQSH